MLKCKGSGGLQELRDTLDEDSINFCLFRFMSGDQESKRVKFMCAAGGTAHPHTPCEGCRRLSLLEVRTSTGAPMPQPLGAPMPQPLGAPMPQPLGGS